MSQSLAALKVQAQHSYRYWHVLLEYHKRLIEQRLRDAGSLPQAQLGTQELLFLQTQAFPGLPQDLGATALPQRELVGQSKQFFFWAGQALDESQSCVLLAVRQHNDDHQEAAEILAVAATDCAYLQQAALRFNACLKSAEMDAIYNAARLWSALHDSEALPFVALDMELEPVVISERVPAQQSVHEPVEEDIPMNDEEDFASVQSVQLAWDEDW